MAFALLLVEEYFDKDNLLENKEQYLLNILHGLF